jgi:undecaprenyl phosphate-alpha-L-ara4N flippase subunit ArnE
MSITQFGIVLIVLCTVIEGIGQVCLKKSSTAKRRAVWVVGGTFLLIGQGVLYTYTLQWLDISTAYPLCALSFVVVALLSRWLLAETITPMRWAGVGLIMAGCVLIAL